MKIAMLIDWRDPIFWWGQVHVKYLSELLIKNHNSTVDLFVRKLIWDDGKAYTQDEILLGWKLRIFRIGPLTKFFSLFGRLSALFLTIFFLLYKTFREKYDIIHAHAYVSWLPAKIVWFITRTPVVYTVHWTMWLDAEKKWILFRIERWLICGIRYDLEISVSHKIFDYSNVNKNIVVLHNGVDVDRFDSFSVDRKNEGVSFLYVGRVDWQKWHKYLIEAISMIDPLFLRIKWFVFNLIGDGYLLPEIKQLTTSLWLDEFVCFKGKMFGKELVEQYKKNHIFILPSLAEWQPLTVLEAFATKLPVIATDVWDNSYFIKNWENWFLLPPADTYALKCIIEQVLSMGFSDYERLWKNGYDMIIEKYTRDLVVERTYKEYENLAK